MRKLIILAGAGFLSASVGLVGPSTAGPAPRYPEDAVRSEACAAPDGTHVGEVTLTAPLELWPPNHRYQAATLEATAEDEGVTVELASEGTHDELVDGEELRGSGNTDPDVSPASATADPAASSATTRHRLRSERSGVGEGRTYTVTYRATFARDGATEAACSGGFDILVPHHLGGGTG